MSRYLRILLCAIALLPNIAGWAQSINNEKFAVRVTAGISLGDAMNLKSSMPELTCSSSNNDFGVDFGWSFWRMQNHSLEGNIGVGYSISSIKLNLGKLNYSYSAPENADMDGDSYVRFYELKRLNQKVSLGRLSVPLYLKYSYRCTKWLGIHADAGVNIGIKLYSKISDLSGEGFSYGVYPQYEDLVISENYLNDFGRTFYSGSMGDVPYANSFSYSVIAALGAEFRIYGPLAADLSFRYNAGLTDLYKTKFNVSGLFDMTNAPVSYLVDEGQSVKSLTDYLTTSKLSSYSANVSLIYRF